MRPLFAEKPNRDRELIENCNCQKGKELQLVVFVAVGLELGGNEKRLRGGPRRRHGQSDWECVAA
jgi:hypothetical protein